jgi:hypothetical protein
MTVFSASDIHGDNTTVPSPERLPQVIYQGEITQSHRVRA